MSESPGIRRIRAAVKRKRETEAAWIEALQAARAAGYSYRQIAEYAGVSHQQVRNILNGRDEVDPVKAEARRLSSNALARGDLQRQPCETCGTEKAEMHHDDYSQPLAVRWLCRSHHAEHHATERAAGR